jgi:hypothetical protein
MISTFSELLRKQIRGQMNDLADHLAGGGASSFDEYRDTCGEIRGLARAETWLLELTKTALGEGEPQ